MDCWDISPTRTTNRSTASINSLPNKISEPPVQQPGASTQDEAEDPIEGETESDQQVNIATSENGNSVSSQPKTNEEIENEVAQSSNQNIAAGERDRSSTSAVTTDDTDPVFAVSEKAGSQLYINRFSCYGCALTEPATISWNPPQFMLAENHPPSGNNDIQETENSGRFSLSSDNGSASSASPLALGVAVGPDLSTVGSFSNFSKPGYQLGIGLEYSLSKNIAVRTGVARADVRYVANGSEYKPPYGYWTNGIVADKTVAQCAILEIPLALKFNLWDMGGSRLFATGGVSSYIMLSEEYHFNYNEPDYDLVDNWSDDTGTRHWFSTASFSVGYEIDLLSNTSFRIEPFVKLPIKRSPLGKCRTVLHRHLLLFKS
ncbi:MAG: hypothetical protein U5K69_20770 [Balneolaceae bacterium]|nr:hypothetical protein [Balneolaceae bacterium]